MDAVKVLVCLGLGLGIGIGSAGPEDKIRKLRLGGSDADGINPHVDSAMYRKDVLSLS